MGKVSLRSRSLGHSTVRSSGRRNQNRRLRWNEAEGKQEEGKVLKVS